MSGKQKFFFADYEGREIGSRTVISDLGMDTHRQQIWKVRCRCGHEGNVAVAALLHGRNIQCRNCANTVQGRSGSKQWRGYGEIPGTAFGAMRALAKRRRIYFGVSIEYLASVFARQDGKCALTGELLKFPRKASGLERGNASLDRIENNKPYIEGNVWFVTKQVNFAKHEMTVSQLIDMCRSVVEFADA